MFLHTCVNKNSTGVIRAAPSRGSSCGECYIGPVHKTGSRWRDTRARNHTSVTRSAFGTAQRLRERGCELLRERLDWLDSGRDDVLRFARPNGWQIITNFGLEPVEIGTEAAAAVVLASRPLEGSLLPGEATVWLAPAEVAPTAEE